MRSQPCAPSQGRHIEAICHRHGHGRGHDGKSLECIGNFYDAADPIAFEHVLQLVLEQAMHNTTLHIDLLNQEKEVRGDRFGLFVHRFAHGVHDPQYVHTLRWGGTADTLYVDPLPVPIR